jgi:hypothetical protein
VKAGEMLALVPFWAEAENNKVPPSCTEALTAGVRVILAGKGFAPAGFFPPQAGSSRNKKITRRAPAH